MNSTYFVRIKVPRSVELHNRMLDREEIFAWLWGHCALFGLLGVHEGSLLSEEAHERGFETESWTIDAGTAPHERDWVRSMEQADAVLYFETRAGAEKAVKALAAIPELSPGVIEEQKARDWDAEWKASFTGVRVPPFWNILPPWVPTGPDLILRINPGAGFGTGTHETTQLCLRTLGEYSVTSPLKGLRVIDFGSGSGILSIGAALLGAQVDGVEIDPLAIDNAVENARLNLVDAMIRYTQTLDEATGPYDLVISNILRPVLMEFAEALVERMAPKCALILSGLIESDVPIVTERFEKLLRAGTGHVIGPEVGQLNEWRSLVWRRT